MQKYTGQNFRFRVQCLYKPKFNPMVSSVKYLSVLSHQRLFKQVYLTGFTGSRTAALQKTVLLYVYFTAFHFVISCSLASFWTRKCLTKAQKTRCFRGLNNYILIYIYCMCRKKSDIEVRVLILLSLLNYFGG